MRKSLGSIKLMLQGKLRAGQELNILLFWTGKVEMIRSRVNVYLSYKLGHLRVKGHALNNYIDKHKLGIMITYHYIYIMSNFPKGNEESDKNFKQEWQYHVLLRKLTLTERKM